MASFRKYLGAMGPSRMPERAAPRNSETPALIPWLRRGGASFPKLSIGGGANGERGVFATSPIAERQFVLKIPRSHIITREIAQTSDVGKTMRSASIQLEAEDSYLAAFLLQEKHAPGSFWKPYLDSLPPSFPTVPLFFSADELALLQGSFLLDATRAKAASLLEEYDLLKNNVSGFKRYTLEEFVWARTVVITRNFGLKIDGVETRCLVPMADMMNHRRPPDTEWAYAEQTGSFMMKATRGVQSGAEVFDSYGAKCNSRFLLNYGFTVENNDPDNEVLLRFGVPSAAPWVDAKRRLLGLNTASDRKSFKVPLQYGHAATQAMLSFLRVALAAENELGPLASTRGFDPSQVGPVSTSNEARVFSTLSAVCETLLAVFGTTAEDDFQLLLDPSLPQNTRNSLVMRSGEKRLLRRYADLAKELTRLLHQPWAVLQELVENPLCEGGPGDAFVQNIVEGVVQNNPWMALGRAARRGHHFEHIPPLYPGSHVRGGCSS